MSNNILDWIFGRGMSGTYRCPDEGDPTRIVIETGYLNMILHGGLVMLIPFVTLLLYSSYKGFFCSNSYFVKSCSLIVFFHLLQLFPGGHLRLTMDSLIVFVFIRICISSSWRNKTDNLIINNIIVPKHCSI